MTTPSPGTVPREEFGESFGRIVRRQFFKRKLAVLGLAVVIGFFLCATLAPFLADNVPLALQRGGRLELPVLAFASREDILWWGHLVAVLLVPVAALAFRRRIPPGGPQRFRFLAGVLLGAVALTYVVAFARPVRLDTTDWKATVDGLGPGEWAILPLVPHGPYEQALAERLRPPDTQHWLGTDPQGRDVLARMVHGARVSLIVGFFSVSIALAIGLTVGSLAGYYGGAIDLALQRVIEIFMCFPTFFFILILLAFLPPSIFNVMIAIGIFGWTGVARLTRGEVLRLKGDDFVTAAKALGASEFRTLFRHLLPNALTPALISATFGIAGAILAESGLSFLGFGTPPPTPSWGALLSTGQQFIEHAWWLTVFPGMAIFIAVSAYNLVGEGLRDALDPRLRR